MLFSSLPAEWNTCWLRASPLSPDTAVEANAIVVTRRSSEDLIVRVIIVSICDGTAMLPGVRYKRSVGVPSRSLGCIKLDLNALLKIVSLLDVRVLVYNIIPGKTTLVNGRQMLGTCILEISRIPKPKDTYMVTLITHVAVRK
jgi:hypothetical protein